MDSERIHQDRETFLHFTHTSQDIDDQQALLASMILKELLALPPAVINPPVFRKVITPHG